MRMLHLNISGLRRRIRQRPKQARRQGAHFRLAMGTLWAKPERIAN